MSRRIEHLLKRAADRAAKQARTRVENAVKHNPFQGLGRTTEAAFAAALSKALSNHGARHKNGRASLRMTAPDTGGRPFHFDHTAVSKKTIALRQGETAPATRTYGKRRKEFARPKFHTTSSGAHMAYIERDGAAEAIDIGKELDPAMERGGRARTPGGMQGYLENDEKLSANNKTNIREPAREVAFSFGTQEIGETLEERIEFWDLAEKYAMGEIHTIQHRLIVELPHECSAEDRLAIMRSFTRKYEDDGIPFWCVLHAPVGGKNDDRNFHAHIVLHGRPAQKIDFAEDGIDDGTKKPIGKVWDFAAITRQKDAHRKTEDRYRHRQNVPQAYRRTFVADERERFSQAVNAQMTASGIPVRYDHRSYKAMGLPVEAMKSVKSMILEKSKAGERLVINSGQTKRLVEIEIDRLARERRVDLSEVERIKRAVSRGTSRLTQLDREARHLGGKGLVRHAGHALKKAYVHAALRYALAKQAHVNQEIELRFEVSNLRRHIEATDPAIDAPLRQKIEKDLKTAIAADDQAAAREVDDRKRKPIPEGGNRPLRKTERAIAGLRRQLDALPDPQILALIHKEAVIELARAEREHAGALAASESRVMRALRNWGILAERPAPVELPDHTEQAGEPPVPNYAPRGEPDRPKSLYRHYPESAHDMINQTFNTPHARAALELTNRISDHIQEAAKIKVPGKGTAEVVMDEVKALVEAFKKGHAQGELALTIGPRDRTRVTSAAMGSSAGLRPQRQEAVAQLHIPTKRTLTAPGPTSPNFEEASPAPDRVVQVTALAPQEVRKAEPAHFPVMATPTENEHEIEERRRKKRERERERRRALAALRTRNFDMN